MSSISISLVPPITSKPRFLISSHKSRISSENSQSFAEFFPNSLYLEQIRSAAIDETLIGRFSWASKNQISIKISAQIFPTGNKVKSNRSNKSSIRSPNIMPRQKLSIRIGIWGIFEIELIHGNSLF